MQLSEAGFDTAAVARSAQSFDPDGIPRRYSEPPWSMPANSMRLLALPLDDKVLNDASTQRLGARVLRAADELRSILPHGARSWMPPPGTLHMTVFHPGFSPGEVNDAERRRTARAPSEGELRRELTGARRIATSVRGRNMTLEVDKLVVTSAGVLLLLLRPVVEAADTAGTMCIETLRAEAKKAFRLAARRQTHNVVHCSLLRILSLGRDSGGNHEGTSAASSAVEEGPSAAAAAAASRSGNGGSSPALNYGANASVTRAVRALTERWSRELHGSRAHISGLLYVRESQIMTLEGQAYRLPFGGARSRSRAARRLMAPNGYARASWASARLRSSRAAAAGEGSPPLALAEVLAAGGTRPGYDHDRDDGGGAGAGGNSLQQRTAAGRIGVDEDNLAP